MDDTDELRNELERVRAERDQLAAQLSSRVAPRPPRHVVRRIAAVVLVVVSCASFLTGGVGVWASRSLLDTDVWVQHTGPLIDDPAVQAVVTTELTDAVMQLVDPEALFAEVLPERGKVLAGPLSGAVRGFVADQVAKVVDSDAFARLWREANREAHAAAVRVLRGGSDVVAAGDDEVTLDLIPVVNRVLARITSVSPELLGHTIEIPDVQVDEIPSEAIARINDRLGTDLPPDFGQITVYDRGKLSELQDAVRFFNRIVWLSVVVFAVSTVAAIAVSVNRRRTVLQLAIADAVLLVLLRRAGFRAQEQVLELVRVDANRPAVDAVTDAMLSGLFEGTRWLLWLLGAVIVVVLVSGPSARARALRARVSSAAVGLASAARERGSDPATTRWIIEHRDMLQVAVAVVVFVLLWWVDLSWVAILAVLTAGIVAIWLLARLPRESPPEEAESPPEEAESPPESEGAGSSRS